MNVLNLPDWIANDPEISQSFCDFLVSQFEPYHKLQKKLKRLDQVIADYKKTEMKENLVLHTGSSEDETGNNTEQFLWHFMYGLSSEHFEFSTKELEDAGYSTGYWKFEEGRRDENDHYTLTCEICTKFSGMWDSD